jgi:hypothetical protein
LLLTLGIPAIEIYLASDVRSPSSTMSIDKKFIAAHKGFYIKLLLKPGSSVGE